jgi:hypothetical protein
MKIIDMNDGIRIIIDDTCTIRKGETLVETRDNFLEYMGQMFDEAIYNSLTEDITGGRGLRNNIPNIPDAAALRQRDEWLNDSKNDFTDEDAEKILRIVMGRESIEDSYDALKEIADYMQKGSIGREILDNLK